MDYDRPLFYHVMQTAARANRDVVDMVSGGPDWNPPDALREGLRAYAGFDVAEFQYPPSTGLRALREEIAARRNVDVDNILVTNGAGEANYLAVARALDRDAGTGVVLTDPVYPYYPGKTQLLGGQERYVEAEDDGSLNPDRVRDVMDDEAACIIVNTPNNPTGAVYSEQTLRELVDIAEAHDALLVSDEVYDHFDLSGEFTSALAIDSPNRIVVNAFSKSLAITGFRVGYVIVPDDHADAMRTRHMLVNVTGSRPAQYGVLEALRRIGPTYFAENRERLRKRVHSFTSALDEAGADYTTPDGGFYVLARFDGFEGTLENVERLIDEAGVACMPGETFGESRRAWLRFALCTSRVREAADRLREFFK